MHPSALRPDAMTTAQHDSKTRFLDAALELIRTQGYASTTVDDLCNAAQLTKGSFFHHFKSKDDLALAAADHFGRMAENLFAHAPYHGLADPLARVLGYVDFRRSLLQGDLPAITCLLGTLVQETYATHPDIREACERHITAHAAGLVDDIAEARRRHAPQARWSAESLAMFTQATLQGAFILAKARQNTGVADEALAHLRRYLLLLFDQPQPKE